MKTAPRQNKKKGFTIFFAMLVGGLTLAIGVAIYDLTVRELNLSATALQSQYAIYAANTGIECALYWDFKYNGNETAFATSSASSPASSISCNGLDITPVVETDADSATTTFTLTFSPEPYCAAVMVAKAGDPSLTTVQVRGYNDACPPSTGGPGRLERSLRVTF